jgi:hypothetical protein
MGGRRVVGIVVVCGLSLAACAKRSLPPPPPPVAVATLEEGKGSLTASNVVTATATVESINQRTRMVTLRRANGERIRFRVGDNVRNLPQVRRGDLVNVTYYESVALRLKKPGKLKVTVDEDALLAPPGELPAGAVGREVRVLSKVVALDRRAGKATLELPTRERITFAVADPTRLKNIRVGDRVEATYREALAIRVENP